MSSSGNNNAYTSNNTERFISESKLNKREFVSLSNSYSNYLHKSLDRFINSSDDSVDKELVSKITQIHKDKANIDQQHDKMMQIHGNLVKISDKLVNDVTKSERFLLKNKLIIRNNSDGSISNTLQKKSELIDQDIRILEHCVRLLEENKANN